MSSRSETLAIKTNQLSKTFGTKEAVSNCSMSVEKGKIYGLLGKNGAGKTTLFKLLLGLLRPTYGSASILGMDSQRDTFQILKKVGALIEVPIFYEALSARDNLKIHLEYMGAEGEIEHALSIVGLPFVSKEPVATFSMGMRQRLAIARGIIHKPELLILDEPVNGLDPTGIKEIRDLFLCLAKKEKITILLSSHILSEVEKIADNIGFMVNGRLVEETTPDRIKNVCPEGLEEYFLHITKRETEHE